MRMNSFLATTLLLTALPLTARAQLINVDKNYTIKKVDTIHNRLEVKYLDAAHQAIKGPFFVDIDGHTQVMFGRRPIPWTSLRPGWQVQVKGGLEPALHIHAKTIIVHKT